METNKNQQKKPARSKWKKVALVIFLDTVLLAASLLTFAYYHHVKPREISAAPVVIERPTEAPTAVATPTPDTEAEVTPEPTEAPPLTWKEKFADKFSDSGVVLTENSYISENTHITITRHVVQTERPYKDKMYSYDVIFYVADIYITDVEQFSSAFAKGEYQPGAREATLSQIMNANGIIGVNGDNYGSRSVGLVIRNGAVYRDTLYGNDVMVLYYDGTMVPYMLGEVNVSDIIANGPYQAWEFGPVLVKDGQIANSAQSSNYINADNPRTAIGYYEPGHYCMVVVEGREPTDSLGADINLLSQIMFDLGCESAYNLDGGQTSAMAFNGDYVNIRAGGGRLGNDTILILDPNFTTGGQ